MLRSLFPKRAAAGGFTLIELIIVILLLTILSVMLMPKWTSTGTTLNYDARRILNDIRYTQALSVATGQRYRWVKVSSTVYQILNESGTAIVLPSGSTQVTLTNGVTIGTLTNLPNNLVAFNSMGAPYTTATMPGTALATTANIPVTVSGITRTIVINATTGYGALA
jgi:prepilin-type N-terminal cleavage/methylation domain-containing protein